MNRKIKFEDFINHCNIIFNYKYDYSETVYMGMKKTLSVICPIHGKFIQKAQSHYLGHNCLECSGSKKLSTEEIIIQFKRTHGDKYDYSKVEYVKNKTPVEIICKEHGHFLQSPYEHKNGQGCPKCLKNRRLDTDLFIELAKHIHVNIYDYIFTKFVNSKTKVSVTCKKHGTFQISPNHHLRGRGCPNCKRSIGENTILKYLICRDIRYIQQKYFDILTDRCGIKLFFDFYLPDRNILIEYDGQQHFEPIEMFGGQKGYLKQLNHDSFKNDFCDHENIKLIRIPFTEIKNIEIILSKILDSKNFD